jgi:hypothetical protein
MRYVALLPRWVRELYCQTTYVHSLPQHRPQLDTSLPPEDESKFLAYCVLSENLPQFDFGEFLRHSLETNTPTV